MGRLTEVQGPTDPDNNGQRPTTSYYYSDTGLSPSITTESVLNASGAKESVTQTMDGIGHVVMKEVSSTTDSSVKPVYTTTSYDGMGQVYRVSSPYETTGDPTYGLTTYTYDGLGRIKSLARPSSYGTEKWSYTGNTTLFTDERNNQRQLQANAFGQTTFVWEPNGVSAAPTLQTAYLYDPLGNLTSATQTGASGDTARVRTFSYDGLSQLRSATNPETGTATYTYDGNGNLIQKTSPAVNFPAGSGNSQTQAIGYCYDSLNRLVAKSNVAPPAGCTSSTSIPTANLLDSYSYDVSSIAGATNVIGRLTDETSYSNASSAAVVIADRKPYMYTGSGALKSEQQCLGSACSETVYSPSYTYDLAGNVHTATLALPAATTGVPANPMTIAYGYDSVSRLNSVSSNVPQSDNLPSTLFQATGTSPAAYGSMGLMNASLGVNSATNTPALTLSRNYDMLGRVLSEQDMATSAQTNAGTGSTGSITISGTEQSKVINQSSPSPGQGSISINGNPTNSGHNHGEYQQL